MYPERWLDYLESRDVYRALPHLHIYAREWLELVEIFASFDLLSAAGGINVTLVPAHVARNAKYLVSISVNPHVVPGALASFCCVPQYTGDILGKGYDVNLAREAVDKGLASLALGGHFACKLPPGNYSEDLFSLIALCQGSFHFVELCSPSIGSPDVDCRYLVCRGKRETIETAVMPSANTMVQYALDERVAQEAKMTREFLQGVQHPESRVMLNAAVLDWNKHAHLLSRAVR